MFIKVHLNSLVVDMDQEIGTARGPSLNNQDNGLLLASLVPIIATTTYNMKKKQFLFQTREDLMYIVHSTPDGGTHSPVPKIWSTKPAQQI